MSGICGWLGMMNGATTPGEIIRAMAGGLLTDASTRTEFATPQGAALCLRSSERDGWIGERDGAAAAVIGYPAWSRPDLAALASSAGHAAALLQAYREHGPGLLQYVRGTFAVALVDGPRGEALLAIDRIGVESLAFAPIPSKGLIFGSTTDAVRRHSAVSATVRLQGIFEYFYFIDRVPAPNTIYAEQQKLLPGQFAHWRNGTLTLDQYWRMPYATSNPASPEALHRELNERLRVAVGNAVSREDPQRVGAFLSGGLDSSTVVGVLAGLSPTPVRAFSIGFDADGFDEMEFARIAARRFKVEHHAYYVTPDDVFDIVQKIVDAYDEPFANSSAIPAYYCARLAREHGVDVMLAGDGGDELFAGNKRYVSDRVFDAYSSIPGILRRGVIEPIAAALPASSSLGRKARNYIGRANMSVPERWGRENIFAESSVNEVFEPDFVATIERGAPFQFLKALHDGGSAQTPLQRMLQIDLRLTLADCDIRKVNRMCQIAGMRVRYPFFDHELVEYAAGIPSELLIDGGKLRAFYKAAMRDLLPQEILQKKKHGFGLPYISFVAQHTAMREMAYDSLKASKRRGYLRPAFIDRLVDSHRAGRNDNFASIVWDVMVLELWLQRHVDHAAQRREPIRTAQR